MVESAIVVRPQELAVLIMYIQVKTSLAQVYFHHPILALQKRRYSKVAEQFKMSDVYEIVQSFQVEDWSKGIIGNLEMFLLFRELARGSCCRFAVTFGSTSSWKN